MAKLHKYKIKERTWKLINKDRELENNRTWHYTNLQPLWWQDNLRKGTK